MMTKKRGEHRSGKPRKPDKVREFVTYQGIDQKSGKWRENLVRKNCLLLTSSSALRLHLVDCSRLHLIAGFVDFLFMMSIFALMFTGC